MAGPKDDLLGILEPRKPGEMYVPSIEERELSSALTIKFQHAYRHRLVWERQWEINWLYQRGEQPVRNLTTGDVFRLPQDDRSRLISGNNLIRPTARSLLGKLTKNIPTCTIVPPTADLSDINGAQVADSLLYFLRRKEKLDKKFIKVYRNVITFGMGWLKLSWDRTYGREIGLCKTCGYRGGEWSELAKGNPQPNCPQCETEATEQYQGALAEHSQQLAVEAQGLGVTPDALESEGPQPPPPPPPLNREREGDIRVDVLDPREVFIDPSASEFEDAQWWCHRVALPVSEVRRRFPKMAKYIDKEAGINTETYVTLVRGTTSFRAASRQLEDHTYLYEFHEKPTEKHPDGRIIWMANSLIVDQTPDPYFSKLGRFNLYIAYWERNAGELYGESWIEQAAPLQREYNILLTQTRENRELMNSPQGFIDQTSGLSPDEVDNVAGHLYFTNPMSRAITWRPIQPLADYTYSEIARLEGAVRTHACVTEQEVGQTRSDASGRYVSILEAEASQQVGPVLKENAVEWIELHRGMLVLAQEFYTTDRVWTVTGTDRPRTYSYENLNLTPGWDVDIQEDDALSKNQAVRLSQTMELANGPITSQLFVDPKTGQFDIKKFLSKSGLKMPDMSPETKSGDHAWAASLPDRLKNGEQITPREWDDPEIYVEELEAWLKGPGRNEDPNLVNSIAQYYTFYLQRTQAALMQRQAMMSGQFGSAGGAQAPATPGAPASPADQSGQGGGGPPSNTSPSSGPEAAQIAGQADKSGESTSRQQSKHEG